MDGVLRGRGVGGEGGLVMGNWVVIVPDTKIMSGLKPLIV